MNKNTKYALMGATLVLCAAVGFGVTKLVKPDDGGVDGGDFDGPAESEVIISDGTAEAGPDHVISDDTKKKKDTLNVTDDEIDDSKEAKKKAEKEEAEQRKAEKLKAAAEKALAANENSNIKESPAVAPAAKSPAPKPAGKAPSVSAVQSIINGGSDASLGDYSISVDNPSSSERRPETVRDVQRMIRQGVWTGANVTSVSNSGGKTVIRIHVKRPE